MQEPTPAGTLGSPSFYGYPKAEDFTATYKAHKGPENPALRGTVLRVGALLLPRIPGLPRVFYKNAGWPIISRLDAITEVDGRYYPAVIPARAADSGAIPRYTDPSVLPAVNASHKNRFYSIIDYHEAYKSGKTTPTEVVEALFPIIRRDVDKPSKHAIAWVNIKLDIVRAAAKASTERWKEGKPLGVLDGVPIGVKDEMDLKGYPIKNLGSKLKFDNKTDETSWCVELWEKEGAIILGKLNMHEFGLDTSNNNITYGTPINPYNEKYYPGGSSGGSSSSVGSGVVPFALGCDGGGSIRLPSAWCGIYGLKTSHGRVSTRPYVTRAKSTSVAGPMAANMVDLEVAYRVMAQPDPKDETSSLFPSPTKPTGSSSSKKLGIYKIWFDRADGPVKAACQKMTDHFTSKLGYELVDITIPHIREAQMSHALTILNEATVTLGKHDLRQLTAPNRIVIAVGRQASVSDILCAQRIRNLLMRHLANLFKEHPGLIILTPTTPNAGWPINPADLKYGCSNGNQSIRNMEYVWLANFTGVPSLSVPAGYVDPIQGTGKIPVGLMAHGEWGAEDDLIEFGYHAEAYLNDTLEGGRVRPKEWVDVFGLLDKKTEEAKVELNGVHKEKATHDNMANAKADTPEDV